MKFNAVSKGLIFTGGVFSTLISIAGFFASDYLVGNAADGLSQLKPGTKAWESWRMGTKLLKFYFFNITNPKEIQQGETIKVKEVGPYIYRVAWEKVDIAVNNQGESIKYRTASKYTFDKDLNDGLEEDKVNLINLIFVSTANTASKHVQDDFLMTQLEQMLVSKGESLTRTETVRNVVLDGISVKPYADIFRNPATKDIIDNLEFEIPLVAKQGKFSLLKTTNPQEEGYIEINSGEADRSKTGNILEYDGMAELPYWSSQNCNALSATDGSTFSPAIEKETVIRIYAPGMCRTMTFIYNSTENVKTVNAFRFATNLEDWKSGKSNPENACYCPANEHKEDETVCTNDGIYSISACTNGAPLVLSLPHFYGASDSVSSAIQGLSPDPEAHLTRIDFHPETGKVLKGSFRVQLNVDLKVIPSMETFSKLKPAIVPFAWTEEESEINEEDLKALSSVDSTSMIVNIGRIGVFAIGLILMAGGFVLAKNDRRQSPVTAINDDTGTDMYKSQFSY